LAVSKTIDGRNLWPALSVGEPISPISAVLAHQGRDGDLFYAYYKDDYKLISSISDQDGTSNALFAIVADPYEQEDLANIRPDVLESMTTELDAMEKHEPVSLHELTPDPAAPGSPRSAEADNRPAIAMPYAESGPVPYPEGNYASRDQ
jgi:hypothetical protein